MFSSVESCRTKRANSRLVASSIMAIRYSFSPRPSSQSCSLVSHCTSSPLRLRRGRQVCTSPTRAFLPLHSSPLIIHCRTVSLLASIPCFSLRYSAAKVGLNPWYTGADRIFTASRSIFSSILRFPALPRNPWTTAWSPRFFSAPNSRFTWRTLIPSSSAASRCVISFFLAFFSVTSRSRSPWVISSCPSCIPKAWGCQGDISTLLKGDIIILLPHGEDGAPCGIDVSLDRNGNPGYTRVYEVCHVHSNRRRSRLHLPACVVWRLESKARGAVSGLAPEGMGGMAN